MQDREAYHGYQSFALVFMLAGYLIINNVLYISLCRDIQYYGSLKALGTTQKQVRSIVFGQILRLCCVGIPAGLLVTFLLSQLFLPMIISSLRGTAAEGVTSSYPQLIYPLAAIFALGTALLGVFRPVKKIASLSPVEAQRFQESSGQKKNKKVRRRAGGNLLRMALRNVFHVRKRAIMVVASLFLGLTLFLVSLTVVLSMGTENSIDHLMESDVTINLETYTELEDGSVCVAPKLDKETIQKLQALPGVESFSAMSQSTALVRNSDALEDDFEWIYGVDEEDVIKLNQEHSLNIDTQAFERGEFAIIASDDPELRATVKELWLKPIPVGKGPSEAASEYIKAPVGAWVPESFKDPDGGSMLHPAIFISNRYTEDIFGSCTTKRINMNVSPEEEANLLASVKQIAQENEGIKLSSRSEIREMFQGIQFVLTVIGSTLAGIICLIGLLNFANVMIVGLLSRKSEFATMESIGMTTKQVRKLLMLEGLCYGVITLILVMTAGNLLAVGFVELLKATIKTAVFIYPVLPMACVSALILVICMFLPLGVYRAFKKQTIAERIRETM